MNTKPILLVLVVAFVGVGVGYYLGYDVGFERAVREHTGKTESPAANALRVGENVLYVPDQMPGKSIVVEFVTIANPGFVVIHESINGAPGPILGTSGLLASGLSEKIAVVLFRESRDGEELTAMLHRDDGDDIFDAKKDFPVKDEQGNIVMMPFLISRDAVLPDAVNL